MERESPGKAADGVLELCLPTGSPAVLETSVFGTPFPQDCAIFVPTSLLLWNLAAAKSVLLEQEQQY